MYTNLPWHWDLKNKYIFIECISIDTTLASHCHDLLIFFLCVYENNKKYLIFTTRWIFENLILLMALNFSIHALIWINI